VVLIVGAAAVVWFLFREHLAPSVSVELGQVVLLEDEDEGMSPSSTDSELLFQASGWLEPDPWPVNLAVLTDGFVQDVNVKEGDAVTNGQIVATLDPADGRLALAAATADVQAAEARLARVGDTWRRIRALPESDTTAAERIEAEQAKKEQSAALASASVRLEAAQLALERTVIRSDRDGIVLRRYVEPGQKRMAGMDDPHSAVVASVYDPAHLQVRVDVPIAEAGRTFLGQPARITTAMLPGMIFTGRVSRIVGQADIQRNTLQVKVAVDEPDLRLRPDVLCRVEFWSVPAAGKRGEAMGRHTLWVPGEALKEGESEEQSVWVVDAVSQRAHRRQVRVSRTARYDRRLVLDGLKANETVVIGDTSGLEEGSRVRGREGNE
jgi:RND family efflux transporter MFP subunit